MKIVGSAMAAFDTDEAGALVSVEDLTIDGAGSGGVFARNGRNMRLERASLTNVLGPAVAVVGDLFTVQAGKLTISDLRIDGVGPTSAMPMGGLGSIAVGLAGGGVFSLEAERFEITNVDGIGLFAGDDGALLSEGSVHDVSIGLVVVGDTRTAPLLERVRVGPGVTTLFSRE